MIVHHNTPLYILNERFGKLRVIRFLNKEERTRPKGGFYYFFFCKCDCGKNCIVNKRDLKKALRPTRSCGCLTGEIISKRRQNKYIYKRFGKLFVLVQSYIEDTIPYFWCECDCGNVVNIPRRSLDDGRTCCGCERYKERTEFNRRKLENKRFGRLVVKKIESFGPLKYKCLCDCGREVIKKSTVLGHKGGVQSCGECDNRVNGIKVSFDQENIHKLIGGQLNYKIGRFAADIAFVEEKIIVEVDCWYWHADKLDKDDIRNKKLINLGWKIIRLRYRVKLPKLEDIKICFAQIKNNNLVYHTMSDWGKGSFKVFKKKAKEVLCPL